MAGTKNRWVILCAGVCMQIILGGIYAWSTFTPYLEDEYAVTKGQSGLIFGMTIIVFTIVMIYSGRLLTRKGPKRTAGIGAVLFAAGYFTASFSGGSFFLLLPAVGLLAGSGIGFGYVCPLSTGMKWFPNRKGLVTGVAVAGFGGGAVLLSSIANYFLKSGLDVLLFFRWYGLAAGVILFAAAMLLAAPASDDQTNAAEVSRPVFTVPFMLLVAGLFAGTFAGLLIIGHLAPIVQAAGLSKTEAVVSISIFAVGNAVGRMSWGYIYDRVRYVSIPLSLGLLGLCTLLLLVPLPAAALFVLVALLGFGFGSNFVVYAGAVSDYYGVHAFSRIYPFVFLAYGVAGLIGPGSGGLLADCTGSYTAALVISAGIILVVTLLVRYNLAAFKK